MLKLHHNKWLNLHHVMLALGVDKTCDLHPVSSLRLQSASCTCCVCVPAPCLCSWTSDDPGIDSASCPTLDWSGDCWSGFAATSCPSPCLGPCPALCPSPFHVPSPVPSPSPSPVPSLAPFPSLPPLCASSPSPPSRAHAPLGLV